MSYDRSKRLARDKDSHVRAELAERDDLKPEILYFLAADPAAEVRRSIAANPRTPAQANLLLVKDGDEAVRQSLAEKVSRLTPDLSTEEQLHAQRYVVQTLESLARDQAIRVREILATALKDVAHAPPSVIRRLARDTEEIVACPILEFSPLLSDQDLIEIIEEGCASGNLKAISRRKGLGPTVADAIVATDDESAITVLLENKSAQIREQTLDNLVERAAVVTAWHKGLVERPNISSKTAQKLATFVAAALLNKLQARHDLDDVTARLVAQEAQRRLAATDNPEAIAGESADSPTDCAAGHDVQSEAMAQALADGDRGLVQSGLALRSGLRETVVEKILSSGSPKAITALVWKAGLNMRFAMRLQVQMGGITPQNVLNAQNGTDFPLSSEQMEWQLDFFESLQL